jgi:hypothetical protein
MSLFKNKSPRTIYFICDTSPRVAQQVTIFENEQYLQWNGGGIGVWISYVSAAEAIAENGIFLPNGISITLDFNKPEFRLEGDFVLYMYGAGSFTVR